MTVWITDLSNRHCPTCDARLVAPAGRFEPMSRPKPVYVQDGTPGLLRCPDGHALPDEDALRAYAAEHGHGPVDPDDVQEVPRPPGA